MNPRDGRTLKPRTGLALRLPSVPETIGAFFTVGHLRTGLAFRRPSVPDIISDVVSDPLTFQISTEIDIVCSNRFHTPAVVNTPRGV